MSNAIEGQGRCSVSIGLERMSSMMQVDRLKDVVVENSVSLVHRCISMGGTGLRQWVASTSALNSLNLFFVFFVCIVVSTQRKLANTMK